jgi:hypothetical protein
MIHFKKEGDVYKLGLNLYRATGGFVAVWAWYDFAKREGIGYRLRVRLHMAPRILWAAKRWNVIDDYLRANDFELVHREILEDLNATEKAVKRINEPYAYIKP